MPFVPFSADQYLRGVAAQNMALKGQALQQQAEQQRIQSQELEDALAQALQPLTMQKTQLDLAKTQNDVENIPLERQIKEALLNRTLMENKNLPNVYASQNAKNELERMQAENSLRFLQAGGAEKELNAKLLGLENQKKQLDLTAQELQNTIELAPEQKAAALAKLQQDSAKLDLEKKKLDLESQQFNAASSGIGGMIQEPEDISKLSAVELSNLASQYARIGKYDPGAKAKAEFYSKQAEEKAKNPTGGISPYQEERVSRNLESIAELKKRVGYTTAGLGSILSYLPGTSATDLEADLDTLKANIAFGELTAMREASKSGGALGAISDKEAKLLESSLGALSARQSPANLSKNLSKIEESIQRWKNAQQKYNPSSSIKIPNVTSQDQYDSLKSGDIYFEDGKKYRKP